MSDTSPGAGADHPRGHTMRLGLPFLSLDPFVERATEFALRYR